jgi:MFS family permease
MLVFLLGIAFAEASFTMTMVQVPIYLRELGADIRQVGLFFTIALIFPLILRVLGGWLSDSIGRLRAIWIGCIAGTAGYVPYALAPTWQFALLGPALLAVATALIAPSYRAYIADNTGEAFRGRVFGLAESFRTLAWIVGPPIGGLMAQYFGYRWLFSAAIIAYAIAAVIFLTMSRRSRSSSEATRRAPDYRSLRASFSEMTAMLLSGGLVTWLLITDGVRDVAFKMSFDLMPVYLRDIAGLSKQSIGFLDGMHGVAWAVTSALAGWLVDRSSERIGVVLGLATLILSRLSFAFAMGFWGFAFSWILLGIGGGVLDPAINSLVARGVPARMRGITYGLLATSLGLISLPFPWIGSQIWNAFGPRTPFLATVILGSFAILPAWLKLKVTEGSEETPSPLSRPNRLAPKK